MGNIIGPNDSKMQMGIYNKEIMQRTAIYQGAQAVHAKKNLEKQERAAANESSKQTDLFLPQATESEVQTPANLPASSETASPEIFETASKSQSQTIESPKTQEFKTPEGPEIPYGAVLPSDENDFYQLPMAMGIQIPQKAVHTEDVRGTSVTASNGLKKEFNDKGRVSITLPNGISMKPGPDQSYIAYDPKLPGQEIPVETSIVSKREETETQYNFKNADGNWVELYSKSNKFIVSNQDIIEVVKDSGEISVLARTGVQVDNGKFKSVDHYFTIGTDGKVVSNDGEKLDVSKEGVTCYDSDAPKNIKLPYVPENLVETQPETASKLASVGSFADSLFPESKTQAQAIETATPKVETQPETASKLASVGSFADSLFPESKTQAQTIETATPKVETQPETASKLASVGSFADSLFPESKTQAQTIETATPKVETQAAKIETATPEVENQAVGTPPKVETQAPQAKSPKQEAITTPSGLIRQTNPDGSMSVSLPNGIVLSQRNTGECEVYDVRLPDRTLPVETSVADNGQGPETQYTFKDGMGNKVTLFSDTKDFLMSNRDESVTQLVRENGEIDILAKTKSTDENGESNTNTHKVIVRNDGSVCTHGEKNVNIANESITFHESDGPKTLPLAYAIPTYQNILNMFPPIGYNPNQNNFMPGQAGPPQWQIPVPDPMQPCPVYSGDVYMGGAPADTQQATQAPQQTTTQGQTQQTTAQNQQQTAATEAEAGKESPRPAEQPVKPGFWGSFKQSYNNKMNQHRGGAPTNTQQTTQATQQTTTQGQTQQTAQNQQQTAATGAEGGKESPRPAEQPVKPGFWGSFKKSYNDKMNQYNGAAYGCNPYPGGYMAAGLGASMLASSLATSAMFMSYGNPFMAMPMMRPFGFGHHMPPMMPPMMMPGFGLGLMNPLLMGYGNPMVGLGSMAGGGIGGAVGTIAGYGLGGPVGGMLGGMFGAGAGSMLGAGFGYGLSGGFHRPYPHGIFF